MADGNRSGRPRRKRRLRPQRVGPQPAAEPLRRLVRAEQPCRLLDPAERDERPGKVDPSGIGPPPLRMLAEGDPGAGAAASLALRMLRERLPVSFGIVGGARAALDTHVVLDPPHRHVPVRKATIDRPQLVPRKRKQAQAFTVNI